MPDPGDIWLVFRYDDVFSPEPGVCPRDHLRAMELALAHLHLKLDLPAVFAVVPKGVGDGTADAAVTRALTEACSSGSEVALHGYSHQNTLSPSGSGMGRVWARVCQRTKSEFAGLPLREQRSRMVKGKRQLESVFASPVTTFVPPWNSYDAATLTACRDAGIAAISASRAWPVPAFEGPVMVPQTVGADYLELALAYALHRHRPAMVVCVTHVWDFVAAGHAGSLAMDSWERRLRKIAANPRIQTRTVDGIGRSLAPCLNSARLRRHRLLSALLRLAAPFGRRHGFEPQRASYLLD